MMLNLHFAEKVYAKNFYAKPGVIFGHTDFVTIVKLIKDIKTCLFSLNS